jgi:hypothetical protein
MLDMPAAEVNVAATNRVNVVNHGGIRENGGKQNNHVSRAEIHEMNHYRKVPPPAALVAQVRRNANNPWIGM